MWGLYCAPTFQCNPYGICINSIWNEFCWSSTHFGAFFHIHSIWNSYGILKFHMNIPLESRWNGMESIVFHMESLYSMWNGMESITFHGIIVFHMECHGSHSMESIWFHSIPPGFQWNIDMESLYSTKFQMKWDGFHCIPHEIILFHINYSIWIPFYST